MVPTKTVMLLMMLKDFIISAIKGPHDANIQRDIQNSNLVTSRSHGKAILRGSVLETMLQRPSTSRTPASACPRSHSSRHRCTEQMSAVMCHARRFSTEIVACPRCSIQPSNFTSDKSAKFVGKLTDTFFPACGNKGVRNAMSTVL